MIKEEAHLDPAAFVATPGADQSRILTVYSRHCNTGDITNILVVLIEYN
jgi:hypothetical protein